jgi:hypothetical protein
MVYDGNIIRDIRIWDILKNFLISKYQLISS